MDAIKKIKEHALGQAIRFAEESIKEDYSHIREQVFDFEWFKSNMRSVIDNILQD